MALLGTFTASFKPTTSNIILVLVAAFFLQLVISKIYGVYFGPISKFPGPKLWAFSKLPRIFAMVSGHEGQTYAKLHQTYGPVVRTGPQELSFAGNSQAWKDIYGFRRAGHNPPTKDHIFYPLAPNKVHSVINADDTNHGRQRKILSHAFSEKALKLQSALLKQWAALMLEKLTERANGKDKADMLKYYNCTTFDIMADLTFSESLNMLKASKYSAWVETIFASIKQGVFFRAGRKFHPILEWLIDNVISNSQTARKKMWEHWRYTADRVDRRLQREPEHEDLWTTVLAKEQDEGGLSMGEHRSNASLFMIAGTETTATALSGTTFYLLKNPATLQKLTAEVRESFEDFDSITLDALARLKYLNAVLREGLRMYPPVPIAMPRWTNDAGTKICDEDIPANVLVGISQYATNRYPDNFHRANEFCPERWLGESKEFANDNLDAMEPFSFGPRNCLGKNLAWHEMRLLLASIVLAFDLNLCSESANWSDQRIYTLWEKKPLLCTLKAV